MKRKLVAKISKERIYQLANDSTEDIESGTVEEWRAIAKYFQDRYGDSSAKLWDLKRAVKSMIISDRLAETMRNNVHKWMDENK